MHCTCTCTVLNSWIALPLCSGALVPSLVCVYLPRMCSLYCQLHSLLTYMDRFDVVYLHLSLSCVTACDAHVWYIQIHTGSLTSCHVRSRCCWWRVCLHWTWDTLCCPRTCMYTRSPVSFWILNFMGCVGLGCCILGKYPLILAKMLLHLGSARLTGIPDMRDYITWRSFKINVR